jgi:hypothetical protein
MTIQEQISEEILTLFKAVMAQMFLKTMDNLEEQENL